MRDICNTRTPGGKIYSSIGLCKRGCFPACKSILACFNCKFIVCTGAHPRTRMQSKIIPLTSFTELALAKNVKCFFPIAWQAAGVYIIKYKRVWRVPVTSDTQSHLKCLKQIGLQWDLISARYWGRYSLSTTSSQKCSQQELNGQWEKASAEVTSFCSQRFDSLQHVFPVETRPS